MHSLAIGAIGGCVGEGIRAFGCFTVLACVGLVDDVEDEGGGCGEEDVAGGEGELVFCGWRTRLGTNP